jgi:hypothetical protein
MRPPRSITAAVAIAALSLAAACRDVTRPMGLAGTYSLVSYRGRETWEPIYGFTDTVIYFHRHF